MTPPIEKLTREELALVEGRAEAIAQEVLAERRRQIAEEGYSLKHDEAHTAEELAAAGAAYAVSFADYLTSVDPLDLWPWWHEHFKPKGRRHDLVRAAALLIAAIERDDRELIRCGDPEAA